MVAAIQIAAKKIGENQPCFIIAEAGVNHNGSLRLALELVDAAAETGADAVKFQTFKAENLVTRTAPQAEYQVRNTGKVESQYDMLKRLELDAESHRKIAAYCRKKKIVFLSTPFDEESADLLEILNVPAFKIGSGELTNLSFISHVARKGKPMIISTGMAISAEVKEVIKAVRDASNDQIVLLHCVSSYPAKARWANLNAIQTMKKTFGLPVGYSDHVIRNETALAAVALGACVIEKHFTLDRKLPGPDQKLSLEPDEFAELVSGIRLVETALGDGIKKPVKEEKPVADLVRRSLVAACDIPEGSLLTEKHITIKRPGTGLPPAMINDLLRRKTKVPVREGTLFTRKMLA
ncbi:MAG: N-acetylneuraminate synthase [Kiritimatiellae bacterium]|nr:N-acetylneuraminate synthase [Kiritimatiellia bacterium]